MKESEKADALKLARLMRCARKQIALTQVQVANHLNIAQGTYSKIEKAKFVLSAPEWFLFCKLTDIDVNSFLTGHIDRGEEVQTGDVYQIGSFKIPGKYGRSAGTSVRELLPYFQFFKKEFGEEAFDDMIRDQFKIDPDYFIDMGHRVNYFFLIELINHIAQKCDLNAEAVKRLAQIGAKEESHGKIFSEYNQETHLNVVEKIVANSNRYQANVTYKIEDRNPNSIIVSGTFNFPTIDERHLKNTQVSDFIMNLKAISMEQLIRERTGKSNVEVKLLKDELRKHRFQIQTI